MTFIDIFARAILNLIIPIIIIVLVSKLKYFKNLEKSSSKKMIIWGSLIYATFDLIDILSFIFGFRFIHIFGFTIWLLISRIGLILAIIGFVICIIHKNHKKTIGVKNTKNSSDNDITNILD